MRVVRIFPFDWGIPWNNKIRIGRVLKMYYELTCWYETGPFLPLLIRVIRSRVCLFGIFDFRNYPFEF